MKCLTVKGCWSDLILRGFKSLEVRSWATKHRGRLGIHVAARPDPHAPPALFPELAAFPALPPRHLAGEVQLVDVRPMLSADAGAGGSRCDYCAGFYVWVLEGPILYPEPLLLRGSLTLWDYEPDEPAPHPRLPF